MGTYSNVSGAIDKYDCFDCDEGYYCSSVAGGEPTGQCWGGYFCTGGAKTPRQNVTDPGKVLIKPQYNNLPQATTLRING